MNPSRIVANVTGYAILILVCAECCALYPGFDTVRTHLALYISAYTFLGIYGVVMSSAVRSILQPPTPSVPSTKSVTQGSGRHQDSRSWQPSRTATGTTSRPVFHSRHTLSFPVPQ